MKPINAPILVLLVLLAGALPAAASSDLYVIPIAGHVPGANGTAWRTDLVLHNPQPLAITVELALVESGLPSGSDAIPVTVDGQPFLQLGAGETRVITDVLGGQSRDVMGALVVGATLPFVTTSRTYAESSGVQTLGETVHPIAITSDGGDRDRTVLAGIGGSAATRSNLGAFLAASRAPFVVEIELVAASGAHLGTRVLSLEDKGFAHRQLAASEIAASTAVTANVRVLEGEGIVVPYASVVHNGSAESLFVSADAASSAGAAARAMLTALVSAPLR